MRVNREKFLNDLNMVRAGLSPREYVEQSSCLSGDSVLHTLEGSITIHELLRQGKTEFLIYCCDGKDLRIGRASNLRKTRRQAEVFNVILDTGHSIKLTADHLVMMRDGIYRRVDALQVGDSVMPSNQRHDGDYLWIYSGIDTGRIRAHVWVFKEVYGRNAPFGYHIHHENGNTWDNRPGNLIEMLGAKHLGLHTSISKPGALPHVREMNRKRMMGNKFGHLAKGVTKPGLMGNKNGVGGRGGTSEGAKKSWETRRRKFIMGVPVNHKVAVIIPAGREDVYDLSVEKYHNFAANGFFLHNCFAFVGGEVMTFNDEVACRKSVDLSFTGAVQAASLLSILEKMDDPDLIVRVNDNNEVEFKGKRKGFGVTMAPEIHLPVDRVDLPKEWQDLPERFIDAVQLTLQCVSRDESRFLFTCIHLHPKYLEACDNLQIMRCKVDTGLPHSILVRGTSLQQIVDLKMMQMGVTESWIHFRNKEKLVFSCRRYNEEYPSLSKLFKFQGHPITIPRGLADASDRAAVFAIDKAGDPYVKVSLTSGVIRIEGRGVTGWYKEVKKVAYDGPALEFCISPDLLKYVSTEHSEAEITGDKLKVSGGYWRYLTVLGRTMKGNEKEE